MSAELTCPVCERSQVEENICPNCETDLSVYGMLASLPIQTHTKIEEQKRILPIWLPIGVAILFLLLGLGLGFVGNSVLAKQESQNVSTEVATSISIPKTKPADLVAPKIAETPKQIIKSKSDSCGGFSYTVRRGDSLSLIATRFYGDSSFWFLISKANPEIQGRESSIEVDELLLIPNLKNTCING